jgi:LAGLIDADG endonuclease
MSLWGATVITNLMSAIPWVGQDIVESKTINDILISLVLIMGLPIIGIISSKVHIDRKNRLNENEYLSIPTSFLAFLVGFIDGDGYIQITRTGKGYIAVKLIISIHIEDISVLNYIQSVLKIGKIKTYYDHKSPACKLIFNKTELQEVLFPLLLYHNIFFLTKTRIDQFNKAMCIMIDDIKLYSNIPKVPKVVNDLTTNPEGYLNLFFFKNWLVGFTMAEGSFFIKSNKDGCFQLKQRLHINLFEAVKLLFNTTRGIDKDLYIQFGVSSIKDIQNVINFFSFSGTHPLIGLKGIQYSTWLTNLRNSNRYKNLKYPD